MMKFLDSCKCCQTSGRGVETSDCAVGAPHWDPEEGTVWSFFFVILGVLVLASLLVVATMFESAKRAQLANLSLDPAVSSEGFS